MSMLAEPRRRRRLGPNPRGKFFTEDEDNKGRNLLEKMGWKSGDGLGVQRQGITEPIKPKIQMDAKGLGFETESDPWMAHTDHFNALLQNLQLEHGGGGGGISNKVEEPSTSTGGLGFKTETTKEERKRVELEAKSKGSKARIHYHKFVKNKDLSKIRDKDWSCILGRSGSGENKASEWPTFDLKENRNDQIGSTAEPEVQREQEYEPEPFTQPEVVEGYNLSQFYKNQMKKMFAKSTLPEDEPKATYTSKNLENDETTMKNNEPSDDADAVTASSLENDECGEIVKKKKKKSKKHKHETEQEVANNENNPAPTAPVNNQSEEDKPVTNSLAQYYKNQMMRMFNKSTLPEDDLKSTFTPKETTVDEVPTSDNAKTGDEDAEATKRKKKKSKKHKQELEEDLQEVVQMVEEDGEGRKKKKKKSKSKDLNIEIEEDKDAAIIEEEKPRKKKRKVEDHDPVEEINENESEKPKKKKKKKNKRRDSEENENEVSICSNDQEVPSMEGQNEDSPSLVTPVEGGDGIIAEEENTKKDKKKKKKKKELDGEEDTNENTSVSQSDESKNEQIISPPPCNEPESEQINSPSHPSKSKKSNWRSLDANELQEAASLFKGSNILEVPGYKSQTSILL